MIKLIVIVILGISILNASEKNDFLWKQLAIECQNANAFLEEQTGYKIRERKIDSVFIEPKLKKINDLFEAGRKTGLVSFYQIDFIGKTKGTNEGVISFVRSYDKHYGAYVVNEMFDIGLQRYINSGTKDASSKFLLKIPQSILEQFTKKLDSIGQKFNLKQL